MLFSIIIAIIAIIFAINTTVHIIFELKISDFNKNFFAEIIISYLVKLVIPYLIMVTLNIKVILRLRQSKKRFSSSRQTNQANLSTDKGTRFTITTILFDLIFLIFNFPDTVVNSYAMFLYFLFDKKMNLGPVFKICDDFALLLSFSYSAVLIIMFIIFNRIFRKELVKKLNNIFYSTFINSSSNRD